MPQLSLSIRDSSVTRLTPLDLGKLRPIARGGVLLLFYTVHLSSRRFLSMGTDKVLYISAQKDKPVDLTMSATP
jgi:hypothetical protein